MYVDEPKEDFHDFFEENDNQPKKSGNSTLFHQTNPRQSCKLTWGPGCRDHRCSHECRARWAFREATILRRWLNSLADDKHVFFGELVVVGDPTTADHKRFRTKFQRALTALGKDRQGTVKLLAASEVGSNERMHYHFCLVSSFTIKQYTIKTLWTEACGDWRTIVSHSRPRSIDARARYMFKNTWASKGKVRLLRTGSPRATWGHLDFYGPQGKNAVWETFANDLKSQVEEGQNEHGQQQERQPDRSEWRAGESHRRRHHHAAEQQDADQRCGGSLHPTDHGAVEDDGLRIY